MQKSLALKPAKPEDKKAQKCSDLQARQVQEIKQMLESFNCEIHSIALFLIDVLKYIDGWNLPPQKDSTGIMSHGVA